MVERRLRITNTLGLHARAAAQLVRLATRFSSRLMLMRTDNEVEANAKSILSVLHLAAGCGVELLITADGEDEETAIESIAQLFAAGFGEI